MDNNGGEGYGMDNHDDALVASGVYRRAFRLEWHRHTGCTNKKSYLSAGLAAVAAQDVMAHNPAIERMGVYKCWFCSDWHMTSKPQGANREGYLTVERDPTVKSRLAIEAARLRRKLRVKYEREAQGKVKYGINDKCTKGVQMSQLTYGGNDDCYEQPQEKETSRHANGQAVRQGGG